MRATEWKIINGDPASGGKTGRLPLEAFAAHHPLPRKARTP
jgi:hypothetical protein